MFRVRIKNISYSHFYPSATRQKALPLSRLQLIPKTLNDYKGSIFPPFLLGGLFLFYICLIYSGVFSFYLWPQVEGLWYEQAGFFEKISNPHGSRFLVVLIFFVLSDISGMHYDTLFSYSVPFILLTVSSIVARSCSFVTQAKSKHFEIFVIAFSFFFLASVSYFMNGRMMFSFLSSSLLIYVLIQWAYISVGYRFILVVLSLFVATISSGVFIVVFSWLICFLFLYYRKRLDLIFNSKKGFMASLVTAAFFVPIAIIFLNKNIQYFGGDLKAIFLMAHHGMGAIFLKTPYLFAVGCFAFIAFFVSLINVLPKGSSSYKILIVVMFLSLSGGVFGYSVLSLLIVPSLVMAMALSYKVFTRFFSVSAP